MIVELAEIEINVIRLLVDILLILCKKFFHIFYYISAFHFAFLVIAIQLYCNHVVSYRYNVLIQLIHDVINQDEVIIDDVEFTNQEIQDLLNFIESLNETRR